MPDLETQLPIPSMFRRLDLIVCAACGQARIAPGMHAVCTRCAGVTFRALRSKPAAAMRL